MVAMLLLGVFGLLACHATAASAPEALLSPAQRQICQASLPNLYECAAYSNQLSSLSAAQKGSACCSSVQAFRSFGCFCGWGPVQQLDAWSRSVLSDLQGTAEACSGVPVDCAQEEGLIEDVEIIRAGKDTADFGTFDEQSADIMPMLLTEGTADALSFTDFTEAKPVMDFSQGSSSISAEFSGADLPEIFASLEASGLTEMSQNALESGQRISDLDIEVEIDQEGGDPEDMFAALDAVGNWLTRVLGLPPLEPQPVDRMDRTDTLASVLGRVMTLVGSLAEGTQSEVDLEITMENSDEVSSMTFNDFAQQADQQDGVVTTYSIGYEPDSWNEVTFDSATVTTRDSRQPPNPLSSRATSGPILFAGLLVLILLATVLIALLSLAIEHFVLSFLRSDAAPRGCASQGVQCDTSPLVQYTVVMASEHREGPVPAGAVHLNPLSVPLIDTRAELEKGMQTDF